MAKNSAIESRLSMSLGKALDFIAPTIQRNPKQSIMFLGPPGCGKSQGIQQLADRLFPIPEKYKKVGQTNLVDVRLSLFEPIEIKGIPTLNANRTKAKWVCPEFLPNTNLYITDSEGTPVLVDGEKVPRFAERGILFLDEFTCAPDITQKASLQLVLDRKIMDFYQVPENWTVVCAGNRPEDGAMVTKLTKPMANRLMHVTIQPDWTDVRNYWITLQGTPNEIVPEIISFLDFRHDLIYTMDANNEDLAFATPRSWSMCSELLKVHTKGRQMNSNEYFSLVSDIGKSTVGAPTVELISYIKYYVKINPRDIIFNGNMPEFTSKDASMKYAAVGSVTYFMTNTIDQKSIGEQEVKHFIKFINCLDEEFRVLLMKYMNWVPKHLGLLRKCHEYGGDLFASLAEDMKEILS